MRRKCVSMLLAIVMALSLLPGTALAEEEEVITYPVTGGNIYISYRPNYVSQGKDFFYSDGFVYFVSGCDDSVTAADIPSKVDGYTIEGIGEYAFNDCGDLTSVSFPDTLTYIEDDAFCNCTGLTSVTLPDSVTSIGYYAFENCEDLTSVTLPSSITSIGFGTFMNCTSLISMVIPASVTAIGEAAFHSCDSLASVTIPASVTTIGRGAFFGCDSLKDVYYAGTEAQWKAIEFDPNWYVDSTEDPNTPLLTATIHYNSTGLDATDKPSTPDTPSTPSTTAPSFTDVKPSAYYAAPVAWAVEQEITSGTGNNQFSPGRTCNVSEILTFLWRAAGKPEPTVENPFTDVKESNFYYKPALWAYEKGMVTGSTFNPSAVCTRAMAVTFIWQASDSPAADPASFTDVPADSSYAAAVAWAVANGVTEGVGNCQFNPTGTCTRGQIVTFLYRAFAE